MPPGTTLKQAQATREKHRVQRREGTRFAPAQVPTLGETWKTWHADASVSLAPRTVENYREAFARIVPRLGRRKVSEINKADVLAPVRDIKRDAVARGKDGGWTARSTLGPLRLFLDWACSPAVVFDERSHRGSDATDAWASSGMFPERWPT